MKFWCAYDYELINIADCQLAAKSLQNGFPPPFAPSLRLFWRMIFRHRASRRFAFTGVPASHFPELAHPQPGPTKRLWCWALYYIAFDSAPITPAHAASDSLNYEPIYFRRSFELWVASPPHISKLSATIYTPAACRRYVFDIYFILHASAIARSRYASAHGKRRNA